MSDLPVETAAEVQQRAIERLLEFAAPAYRLSESILGSPQAAEDAVQQAYLEAVARIRSSAPPTEPRPWFLRVVALTARHRRRSEANLKRREAAMEPKAESVLPVDEVSVATLRTCLAALDEELRVPLMLCYQEELPHGEIASVLDVSAKTVSRRIGRGLERLQRAMTGAGCPAVAAVVLEGLHQSAPAVPAGLAVRLEELLAGSLGAKAAVGAGAASAAGGLALVWKLLGGLAAVLLLGAVGLGAWKLLPAAPRDAAPRGPAATPDRTSPLDRKVTLSIERGYLHGLLEELHGRTGLRWGVRSFRNAWHEPFGVECRDMPVREVLDRAAGQARLTWKAGPNGEALFNLEDPAFARHLAALRSSAGKDEETRAEAVCALGALDDLRVLPHLARAMADRSALVRHWAGRSLWELIGKPRERLYWIHAGSLADHWKHWMSPEERKGLVGALLSTGRIPASRSARPGNWGRVTRLKLLACLDEDPRARAEVLKALKSADEKLRGTGVAAAALAGSRQCLDKLAEIAGGKGRMAESAKIGLCSCVDPDYRRRHTIAWLEGQLSVQQRHAYLSRFVSRKKLWAIPALLQLVEKGKSGAVRQDAAKTLACFARTEGAGKIAEQLSRLYFAAPKGEIAPHLARALAELAQPAGERALAHALKGFDKNESALSTILHGFRAKWEEPPTEVEKVLLEMARVRKAAGKAADKRSREVSPLLKLVRALGAVGSERSVDLLKAVALEGTDPKGRRLYWYDPEVAALFALRRIGGERARAALGQVGRNAKSKRIALRARFALLAGMPAKDVPGELLKLAGESARQNPDAGRRLHARPPLSEAAAGAARRSPSPELAAVLRKMAGHESSTVRMAAASGMRGFAGENFREEIYRLMADDSPGVAFQGQSAASRRLLRAAGSDFHQEFDRLLGSKDPRLRLAALRMAGGMAAFCHFEHCDELARLAAGQGDAAELARRALLRMVSPRAISWRVRQLASNDAKWRRQLVMHMQLGRLGGLDPRMEQVLKTHRLKHPEDFGRQPGPKPKPAPPEVF